MKAERQLGGPSTSAWAKDRCLKIARRVKRQLRTMPPSGIFDRRDLKNVWDEYCLQVQYGPPALETAWSATINPLVDHEVEQLTGVEAAALTSWRHWLDDVPVEEDPDGYDPEAIRAGVIQELSELAHEPELDWTTG